MSTYVFVGPTLPVREARAELDAVYLPPARQGDIYRVACRQPKAIGVIDGYFERVPSVWHKEILWAMSQGIHVFGSASMGALRAAELAAFGMEGVGAIFRAFRDAVLTDDDEVAIVHAAADRNYHCSSEAMVNIRRTLSDAERAGVVSRGTHLELTRIAKQLFYPDRSYPTLLDLAHGRAPEHELQGLRAWLSLGRADQKREDALEMLRLMRGRLGGDLEPKRVQYSFAYTAYWDELCYSNTPQIAENEGDALVDSLLEELRIDGDAYVAARQGAMLRALELDAARRLGIKLVPEQFRAAADSFRRARALLSAEATEQWLTEHHLREGEFGRLVEEEEYLLRVETLFEVSMMDHILDYLRVSGRYSELAVRAKEKQQALESSGHSDPSLDGSGLSEEALWGWYFVERLQRPVPADIEGYARALGFRRLETFRRAVLREFCYITRPD